MEDFLPNYSLDSLEEEEDGEKEGSKERIAVQGADKYEMQKEEKFTLFSICLDCFVAILSYFNGLYWFMCEFIHLMDPLVISVFKVCKQER